MHPVGHCHERGTELLPDDVSGGRTMNIKTHKRSVVHLESVKL